MPASSTTKPTNAPELGADAPRICISLPNSDPPRSVVTDKPVAILGSRRDCDLWVEHSEVSKVHCAVVNTGNAILVADLCSRTGIFLNGERVSSAALTRGAELRLGPVVLHVEWPDDIDVHPSDGVTLDPPLCMTLGDQVFELGKLPAVIGRRKSCAILLDTPDVSLAHTLVFALHGVPMVFDLGSRSGTILNGERVALARLRNEDTLSIGGELLSVAWDAPEEIEAPIDLDARTVPAEPSGGLKLLIDGAPTNLDALVDGVQTALSAIQSELARRMDALVERSADLEEREDALESDRLLIEEHTRDLEQRESEFGVRQAGLAEREDAAARREAAQQQAEEELQKRRDRSRIAVGRLRTMRDQLIEREEVARRAVQKAEESSAQFAAREAELAAQEVRLQEQEAALAALESELSEQSAQVAARQQELDERESREAEAVAKIAMFKNALAEASQVFAAVDSNDSKADGDAGASAKQRPDPKKGHADAGEAAAASATQAWPAPMVERPLFGGVEAGGEGWPEAWNERFAVLRRVSDKPDDELRAQVRAEFESGQIKPQNEPSKKKRWWS